MNTMLRLLDIRCRIFPSMVLLYLKVAPKYLKMSSNIRNKWIIIMKLYSIHVI
jgi:hypothetical protein